MNKKTLFLFTDSFPYYTNEVYIETEIQYLSKHFEKVILFPINISGTMRSIPENVEVFNIHSSIKNERFKHFFKSFWFTLKIYLSDSSLKLRNFKKSMLLVYNAFLYVVALENFSKKAKINSSQLVVYSYWFLHWSLVISILKKRSPQIKSYSRAHMGDLYSNLCDHTFSKYKLKHLDRLFSISKDGQKHLAELFPKFKSKVEVAYLGVEYLAHNPDKVKDSGYIIVSCSSMNSQKRIESFFDILGCMKNNVKWIHFGGMDSEIKALKDRIESLPENVNAIFHGYTPNQKILEYYKNNHVDLFLNLSLSEGIPVTIMEAISFAIPAMATDVCGSPEIVSYDKKMIIDKNFNVKEVAQSVDNFLLTNANDKNYREKVFDFWNEHFNAKINYEAFANTISR